MTPKRSQSGEHDPKLGIRKAGNGALQRAVVQFAHHTLGRRGQEPALLASARSPD
ncbi:MAG: transposase [Bryobacterales bacterium]|nr:transposase [Bryobacterales bacterium]